jgi:hypothetical protein
MREPNESNPYRRLRTISNPGARLDELAFQLERREDADALALLFGALTDPYPPIRRFAAESLEPFVTGRRAEIDDEALASALRALLCGEALPEPRSERLGISLEEAPDPSIEVRRAVAYALRFDTHPETTARLMDVADEADADLRYQAMVSLFDHRRCDGSMVALLERRLEDEDPEIVIVAAQMVAEWGVAGLREELVAARERTSRLFRKQHRFQLSLSVVRLYEQLDEDLREAHGGELRQSLIEDFERALRDEETTAAAAKALAAVDAQSARDQLYRLAKGWLVHPILKVEAAFALMQLGDERGRERFESFLRGRRKDARGYALQLVGQHRIERYYPLLYDLSRSARDYHADTAIETLGRIGDDEARSHLERLGREHPDPDLRRLASEQLVA